MFAFHCFLRCQRERTEAPCDATSGTAEANELINYDANLSKCDLISTARCTVD
jgi:hypothetical protein